MLAAVIVATIAAVSAIVAPSITAHLNNKHQLKMREMEIYTLKKIEAIETYLKVTQAFIYGDDSKMKDDFNSISGRIFMYVPENLWSDIRTFHDFANLDSVNGTSFIESRMQFDDIRAKILKHTLVNKYYQ